MKPVRHCTAVSVKRSTAGCKLKVLYTHAHPPGHVRMRRNVLGRVGPTRFMFIEKEFYMLFTDISYVKLEIRLKGSEARSMTKKGSEEKI